MTTIETASATAITRFNALRHGVLSRHAVLPWEEQGDYQALLAALADEHRPEGPTEEHLVEEIAGIIWRKRRLRMAEAAAFRRGLHATTTSYDNKTAQAAVAHIRAKGERLSVHEAIVATSEDHAADLADVAEDEAMTKRAVELLGSRQKDPYGAALAAMREDTLGWWQQRLDEEPAEDEEPYTADAASVRRFLEDEVMPGFEERRADIANRSLIREQALGESFDPNKLDRLARYEVHLDRKLERMLTMLVRLKELRGRTVDG